MARLSFFAALAGALALGLLASAALAAAPAPSGAPAGDPVSVADFVARCESDARFCQLRLMAAAELLERDRKLCPRTTTKEAMAARVAAVMGDILEEGSFTFKDLDYRTLAEQLLVFLWPCEPIS
jgi:hypothetical protein